MRGRKPQSPLAAGESEAPPSAPDWLHADARQEWDRLIKLIASAGAIAEPDADVLAAYVSTLVTYRRAVATLQEEGLTFHGKGGIKRHPAVAIASDARKDLLRLASELGLTPISRQRLRIQGGGSPDELQLFLGFRS